MKFELNEYHRGVTNDELLEDLRLASKRLSKRSFLQEEYIAVGKFHVSTYFRRFGGWYDALGAAGLDNSKTRTFVSNEDLFRNLEEVWIKLGKQPSYDDMRRPLSKYDITTYKRHFGGWRNALSQFVELVNDDETNASDNTPQSTTLTIGRHKTSRGVNWRLRFVTMKRDSFKCQSCGRSPATDSNVILHVDHKKAWANGGETVLNNLQTLCSVCNIGKSDL